MTFQTELETLIRARYPILYIVTNEEMRTQNVIDRHRAKAAEKSLRVELQHWHRPRRHLHPVAKKPQRRNDPRPPHGSRSSSSSTSNPLIFIFKDFHPFLTKNNFAIVRKLKEIALHLKNSFKTIIFALARARNSQSELEKEVTVLNYPLPTREDLSELLDKIIDRRQRSSSRSRIDLDAAGP